MTVASLMTAHDPSSPLDTAVACRAKAGEEIANAAATVSRRVSMRVRMLAPEGSGAFRTVCH
jgi:hypothetical protein